MVSQKIKAMRPSKIRLTRHPRHDLFDIVDKVLLD